MANEYTPPDPFAAGIAAIRAAESTPESRFAAQFAEARTREFAEQQRAAALRVAQEPPPRITAAELATYTPPNPYEADLAKLRSAR